MKSGANKSDVVQIRKLAEEGYSAEDISDKLQVNPASVKAFIPAAKKKAAPKKSEPKQEIVFSD